MYDVQGLNAEVTPSARNRLTSKQSAEENGLYKLHCNDNAG